ncbi:DUF5710 domain-containing protein [Janthinobacterium sp. B9-8]|uniref:DUF5710 domain-containing protein n=1 Tax=Janthinobacterium sp. B9-8 TaxID=1236179 RepID=UPI00069AE9A1|nr:DUF5710 domain-containing protein [Janthinobacterium sp. B9-8]AMC35225.1 hypothetical protein VN23_11665 [Janthinobacterium sp. B9-8]
MMRVNLKVPFAEKDSAKALGAKWDAAKKVWYIVDKADLSPYLQWIDEKVAASAAPQASAEKTPSAKPLPRLGGLDYGEPPWEVTEHDIILK